MARKYLIDFNVPMAPGDTLMVTALVRDLKKTYGNAIELGVHSMFSGIWRNNPHIVPMRRQDPGVEVVTINYTDEMKASQNGQRFHYVTAFHKAWQRITHMPVKCSKPKGDLYLDEIERTKPLINGRYWIIVPGGKADTTIKYWPLDRYQAVVNTLRPWGLRFVQEGAVKPLHEHPPIDGVFNCVGLTSMRDMMVNMYHCEGVICGVSFPMHMAAVFDKPCVVIAGGREEPWWEAYCNDFDAFDAGCQPVKTPHEFLHTLSQLPCCRTKGCWKRRVVPLPDGRSLYNADPCVRPVRGAYPVAGCMEKIQVSHVVEAVMKYYTRGVLPPLPRQS